MRERIQAFEFRTNFNISKFLNWGTINKESIKLIRHSDCHQDAVENPYDKQGSDQPRGPGILIRTNGSILITKFDGWYGDIGNFIHIFSEGKFAIGENYLDAIGKKRHRQKYYEANGETNLEGDWSKLSLNRFLKGKKIYLT